MTYARSQLVDESTPGFYHCVSRCVRRAFLCGKCLRTGQDYEHRKQWVEDRLLLLAECFSVSVYAYAVMSNHVHVVLRLDPLVAGEWSDEEVARRWVTAFAGRFGEQLAEDVFELRIKHLLALPERLAEIRQRLGSLSWFMRALNEPIARMANREDGCTGRFWEGRFKSQVLLDEQAVLSCMAYVDLNPVRADICKTLQESDHTSIQRRLAEPSDRDLLPKHRGAAALDPVAGLRANIQLSLNQAEYIALVEWTGQQAREDKRGKLLNHSAPNAELRAPGNASNASWLRQVLGTERSFCRAIGSVHSLREEAKRIGQRWLKGLSAAANV